MAELRNSTGADGDTKTIEEFYHGMIVELGSDTQEAHIRYEGASGYLEQLTLRRESVSGVNLDEEAANLILYQRGYEAAARYIGVIDSLLNTLINGII